GYPWLFSLDWPSAYRAAGATANPEAIDLGGNQAPRRSKFSSGDILIGLVAADAERVGLRGGRGGAERPRLGQDLRLQDLVELLAGQKLLGEHQIVNALIGQKRLLRDLGRIGVADIGIERGDDTDRALDAAAQMLAVGGDALHAPLGQGQAAGAQMVDALEQAVRDDRLEGIELQLTGLGGKAHRDVVADNFKSDLVDDFGDHRIDLARHDAGAGLHRRQVDLVQPDARARRQQTQIVAGLRQLDRDTFQDAGQLHEGAAILRRLDQVRGRDHRNAGDVA